MLVSKRDNFLGISWSESSDNQKIKGCNVYLNGDLYNINAPVLNALTQLKILEPETEYQIQIEAIDAGMNVSEKARCLMLVQRFSNR